MKASEVYTKANVTHKNAVLFVDGTAVDGSVFDDSTFVAGHFTAGKFYPASAHPLQSLTQISEPWTASVDGRTPEMVDDGSGFILAVYR